MNHTPGPWIAKEGRQRGGGWWVYSDQFDDALAFRIPKVHGHDAEANARLIASAPELLAACQAILKSSGQVGNQPDVLDAVRMMNAAIAKATGSEVTDDA